jgi:anti-sigma B factor antagonist
MIHVDEENLQITVNISGDIYVEEATVLREKLIPFTEKGYKNFIINLSSVTYIDSSGLGVLVAIHKRVVTHGGGVKIKGVQGKVRELFELTLLTKVFELI